ncbi:hypothetical protein [uncultured Desulfovibrio sp.]|uniref:hypothetical protein n=1 Tax=uncultured Desulfovibrio sp. TaxID=167968 RepID=UPI00260795D0|nr:hypothetical protein [uncultured Desulfovibrio sp.]
MEMLYGAEQDVTSPRQLAWQDKGLRRLPWVIQLRKKLNTEMAMMSDIGNPSGR